MHTSQLCPLQPCLYNNTRSNATKPILQVALLFCSLQAYNTYVPRRALLCPPLTFRASAVLSICCYSKSDSNPSLSIGPAIKKRQQWQLSSICYYVRMFKMLIDAMMPLFVYEKRYNQPKNWQSGCLNALNAVWIRAERSASCTN